MSFTSWLTGTDTTHHPDGSSTTRPDEDTVINRDPSGNVVETVTREPIGNAAFDEAFGNTLGAPQQIVHRDGDGDVTSRQTVERKY